MTGKENGRQRFGTAQNSGMLDQQKEGWPAGRAKGKSAHGDLRVL